MGVYTLLSFIVALAQTFGTLAIQSAAVKYIAQFIAQDDFEKARAVVTRVLQTVLVTSTVAFLALFFSAEPLSVLMLGATTSALLIRLIAVCAVFAIIYIEVAGFLQGMQRIRDAAFMGLVSSIISALVGVPLLVSGWGLYGVVIGWTMGFLTASITGLIITAKQLGILGKPFPFRPLFGFSFPLYASSCIGFFVSWIDQLFLVSYTSLIYGTAEGQRILGIYSVAIRASVVPTLFSSAVVAALFPQLSALYAKQGLNSLREAFRVSTRYAVLIGFPLIVGLATLAYPMVILFGGWQYIDAVEPLIIVSLAALVGTLGIAVGPILLTLERTAFASILSVVSIALSISLSYSALVIFKLGMNGVAWARTFAAVIGLALSLYVLTRYMSISFDKEALWKASLASAFLVIVVIALDLVRRLLSPNSYQFLVIHRHLLPIYVAVAGLVYSLALIRLKAIKTQDVELIEQYLPSKLKRVASWLERFAVAS